MPLALRQHVQMMPRRFDVSWRKPLSGNVLLLPGADQLTYGATIIDRSGYGNHGTITGATWTRLSSGLWVLSFDNVDDVVNCGQDASLALTGDMSFEFWVKPNSTDSYKDIFSKAAYTTDGYEVFLEYNGVASRFRVIYRTNQLGATQISGVTPGEGLISGVYSHVLVTRSGATALFYLNGVSVSLSETGTHIDPTANLTRNLLIGKAPVNNAPLNGYLGLPRMYNQVVVGHYQQERHLFGV